MNLNATLLFQVLFFAGFVWFSAKYVWTPIVAALNERKTQIADGLAAAEKGLQAEQRGQQKAEELIAQAKDHANEIISKADKRGAELVAEAKQAAKQEGDRITGAAHAEIETELHKAKESLRVQVATLAVAGAEKILRREVDGKDHADILDDLVAKL